MNFIKSLDQDLLKKLGLVVGVIIGAFVVLMIFMIIKGNRLNYSQIEARMISAAKEYYKDNSDKLPKVDNNTITISTDKLVEEKYMKSLDKLVKNKNDVCSGQVSVTKNDDNYLYSVTLSCGENYSTKKLKDVIVKEAVTSGNGIYQVGENYIFKGDNVNNYVKFAGKVWRIIRINSDGSIRMIDTTKRDQVPWDDRYNSEKEYNVGINNYSVSRLKDTINTIYNEFSSSDKSYMLKQNLCVGKRSEAETNNDGSIECSSVIENQNVGLIQVNEFALASLSDKCNNPTSPECSNYNYLAVMDSMWTLNASNENSYKVFKISGNAFTTNAINTSQPKIVIHINPQVNYISGNGSEEKPYTFK